MTKIKYGYQYYTPWGMGRLQSATNGDMLVLIIQNEDLKTHPPEERIFLDALQISGRVFVLCQEDELVPA